MPYQVEMSDFACMVLYPIMQCVISFCKAWSYVEVNGSMLQSYIDNRGLTLRCVMLHQGMWSFIAMGGLTFRREIMPSVRPDPSRCRCACMVVHYGASSYLYHPVQLSPTDCPGVQERGRVVDKQTVEMTMTMT